MKNKKLLVLDNYDSFTYNLVHQLVELGVGDAMTVVRNDKITVAEVAEYDKILLSPGPGIPEEAGIMPALLKEYKGSKDIFGVCLGHQAIAEAYGGKIYNMPVVLHGIAEECHLTEVKDSLFTGLPDTFKVCRYHSWSVVNKGLPAALEVTAVDAEGRIMAFKHKTDKVRGVQFHPESIMTEHGLQMIKNWISE